ncbi:hypothetical protein FUSO7_00430 [Fusobacterium necrophorum BFTR-2]|nr:hypothetical protein FUSO7_00430 [Fusobacterium necrophorum BFTR-2]
MEYRKKVLFEINKSYENRSLEKSVEYCNLGLERLND